MTTCEHTRTTCTHTHTHTHTNTNTNTNTRARQNWDYIAFAKALHNGQGKLWTALAKTEEELSAALAEAKVILIRSRR